MPSPVFNATYLDWDVPAILDAAGGTPKALREFLASQNFAAPSEDLVYQWRWREAIPKDWVPTIVYALLAADKAKLSDLLVKRRPS